MKVEEKLAKLGFELPKLEDLYRTNASGAHYISHFPVQNLLYLSHCGEQFFLLRGRHPRQHGCDFLARPLIQRRKDVVTLQGE